MTAPELALRRFGAACLLGCLLGLLYGFLRPLRPKRTALADSLFVVAVWWAWIVLSFQICAGDLGISYTAGLAVGGILWEKTVGRWLRPVFIGFWRIIGKIWGFILWPGKKILEKMKKNICILEKMGYNKVEIPSAATKFNRRQIP